MPADFLHTFPLTHEHTTSVLQNAKWSHAEKTWLLERELCELIQPLGHPMMKCWHLDDKSYPLPRHYMRRFGIGDPGDMVGLIILNWLSALQNKKFDVEAHVREFRRRWIVRGIDPLTLRKNTA